MTLLRRFSLWRCRALGWHPHRFRIQVRTDVGFQPVVRCGRCGYIGIEDSQGNLF